MIAVLVAVLLCGVVILAVPELRLQFLGQKLAHNLVEQSERGLAIDLTLARGNEISGAEVQGDFPFQEDYKLGTSLLETVQSTSPSEEVLGYRVKEMASEQWAWTGGEQLAGAHFLARVLPRGLVSALEIESDKKSPLLDDSVMMPVFCLIWPPLPDEPLRPGTKPWTASFTARLNAPMLDKPVLLEHRLEYSFHGYEKTPGGKQLVSLECTGKVVARYEGPDPVQVASDGAIEGVALIDPTTGLCTGGSYRLTQGVGVVYQEPEGVQYRWKQAMVYRFWNFQGDRPIAPNP